MIRSFLFKEEDYVKYLGNLQVPSGPLREPGFGVINEFEEFSGTERIYLFLRDRNSHIWCDYDKLRPIETEDKHLLAAGFELEMVGVRKRFRRNGVFVSKAMIILNN